MNKNILVMLALAGTVFLSACGRADNKSADLSVAGQREENVQDDNEDINGINNDNNSVTGISKERETENIGDEVDGAISGEDEKYLSGIIPDELEYIPQGYEKPARQQGRLEKLTYDTTHGSLSAMTKSHRSSPTIFTMSL